MFKNYFKIAIRNLFKHKTESVINLIGLSVAFTSSMLLFLSVFYEFSFDHFHKNAKNIYHLYSISNRPEQTEINSAMPAPLLTSLKTAYPGIKYGAKSSQHSTIIKYRDKKLQKSLRFTDPDFFKMFSFPLIKGNAENALKDLNSAVLSEATAKSIFGNEDPIGKIIEIQVGEVWKPFTISAIAAGAPDNSSIKFDAIIRFEHQEDYLRHIDDWGTRFHDEYIQLNNSIKKDAFEKKLAPFVDQNFAEDIRNLKANGAKPDKEGAYFKLQLQPLLAMHTDTSVRAEGTSLSKNYLYLLLTIAILIISIACINFINLSIGRSFTRTREIGLRKTLGAQQKQIIFQFWGEAFLICLLAFFISCFISYMLLPSFKQLFAMNIDRKVLLSPLVWTGVVAGFFIVTVLAGGYPAIIMSRLNAARVLKGTVTNNTSGNLRNSLIVLQFFIAISLIICTLISWQQINYLKSRPVGYNTSQVISLPINDDIKPNDALQLMKQKLSAYPNTLSVTGIYDNLGKGEDGSSRQSIMGFMYNNHEIKTNWYGVSYDFAKTLDLKITEGRDFSQEFPTDSSAVVINETMASQLKEKNIVGTLLPVNGSFLKVIGVVKDFNFHSLHEKIEPLTLVLSKDFPVNYILIKVRPENLSKTMQLVKDTWKKLAPDSPFTATFIDENINRQYKREEQLSEIFIAGAIMAIVLSCMGLFAMVILIVTQRTKEIGIRKVLGASVTGIVTLLSKDFLKLVFISIVIASPVAYWAMNKWLQDFYYRINIGWSVFLIAGVSALVIALITVSFQSIKAATSNPVKSLRTE